MLVSVPTGLCKRVVPISSQLHATCHICSLKSVTEYFHLVKWQVLQIGMFFFLENLLIKFTSMLLPTRIRTLPRAGREAMEKGVALSF